jgi:SAM-dependent methyltransferase
MYEASGSDDRNVNSLARYLDITCCPGCGGDLRVDGGAYTCDNGHSFEILNGIPRLFVPNEWTGSTKDVTDDMKSFYEKNPFPNYDEFDNVGSLIEKARRGLFAKMLDDQIPFGTRVLECGCGTGQLANFLSVANRTVIGTDMCLNSLQLAQDFKAKNDLKRVQFFQMNLFRPCFKPGSFDLVISNGVLHHTSDPLQAFKSISRLVRPNGYILVGLYHRYGRLVTDFRRFLFNVTNDRLKFLDRHAVDEGISQAKRRAWFMDQYKNPHESKHTVPEVLRWLDETGFTFVHCIPNTVPFTNLDESEKLFQQQRLGNWLERLIVNIEMTIAGHREGGFFIIIARNTAEKRATIH